MFSRASRAPEIEPSWEKQQPVWFGEVKLAFAETGLWSYAIETIICFPERNPSAAVV